MTGEDPRVESLEEARFWIGVLHRRSVEDAERFNQAEERLRRLERPWWRRFGHDGRRTR